MLERIVAAGIGLTAILVAVMVVVVVGVGCAAFAIVVALMPFMGLAGAAAVTAALFLVFPLMAIVMARQMVRPQKRKPREAAKSGDQAIVDALAILAEERPGMAMAAAVIFGAGSAIMRERK